MLTRIKHFTIGALYVAMLVGLLWCIASPAGAVLPNIFATQPSGNVAASLLDTNFTFLESQGVQGLTTTGSSNAYVATPADAWVTGYSSYSARALTVIPSFTNTGAATINVSGLGAVSIYKNVGGVATALISGDMVSAVPAILICDGTGFLLTNPTATSASGTNGMVYLTTINASAAGSVAFNSTYITNAYNKYIIEFDGVYGSVNNGDLYLTGSTNNGSTYVSALYQWAGTYSNSSGSNSAAGSTSDSRINITGGQGLITNAAAHPLSGTIKISNPSSSAECNANWQLAAAASQGLLNTVGGGSSPSNIYNNFKLATASGNITGHFTLYGLTP